MWIKEEKRRRERSENSALLSTSFLRQVSPLPFAMDFNVVNEDFIFPSRPCSTDYTFLVTAWPPSHFCCLFLSQDSVGTISSAFTHTLKRIYRNLLNVTFILEGPTTYDNKTLLSFFFNLFFAAIYTICKNNKNWYTILYQFLLFLLLQINVEITPSSLIGKYFLVCQCFPTYISSIFVISLPPIFQSSFFF